MILKIFAGTLAIRGHLSLSSRESGTLMSRTDAKTSMATITVKYMRNVLPFAGGLTQGTVSFTTRMLYGK